MPYNLPSLVALDHRHLCVDKEWKLHKLPKEGISIPRDEIPDPSHLLTIGARAVRFLFSLFTSIGKQENNENGRRWNDAALERIYMGPSDQTDNN